MGTRPQVAGHWEFYWVPFGHEAAFYDKNIGDVYVYDPTDDGPECEVITRILAAHPFFIPGEERNAKTFFGRAGRKAKALR